MNYLVKTEIEDFCDLLDELTDLEINMLYFSLSDDVSDYWKKKLCFSEMRSRALKRTIKKLKKIKK